MRMKNKLNPHMMHSMAQHSTAPHYTTKHSIQQSLSMLGSGTLDQKPITLPIGDYEKSVWAKKVCKISPLVLCNCVDQTIQL